MSIIRNQQFLIVVVISIIIQLTTAWVSISSNVILQKQQQQQQQRISRRQLSYSHKTLTRCNLSTEPKGNDDSDGMKRTSFDEAGRSLVEEEDTKRMEAMGDYDLIPNSKQSNIDEMRAAIRERTANLGMEKSKISADYIQSKQKMAMSAGSARAAAEQNSGDTFAGLDLSQISDGSTVRRRPPSNSLWDNDDDTPSMFFDAEERLTEQEREEVDPLIKKSIIEQGLNELQNAKWPDWASALREVFLMFAVIALTGALIIGWDKVLRYTYTDILHFIPSEDEITNYASRFDGLDLPKGWTDNMNEADVQRLAEKVNDKIIIQQSSSVGGGLPSL